MESSNIRKALHQYAFANFKSRIKTLCSKILSGISLCLLTVACAHAKPVSHTEPHATEVGNYDGDPTKTWDGVAKAGVQVRTFTQPNLLDPGQTVLRRYLQYVPENLHRNREYPLVIMLPGASLSAEVSREWDWGDRAERLADKEKFLLVYANGHAPSDLTDQNPGNPFFANGGYWRACFGKPGTGPEFFSVDDVDYLRTVIRNVQQEGLPVDKKRIYLMGMSNGGEMVQRAAREMPDVLAGVGAVMPVYSMPANVEWFNCGQRPQLPLDMMFIYSPKDTLLDRIFADAGFNYAQLMQDSFTAWREALNVPRTLKKPASFQTDISKAKVIARPRMTAPPGHKPPSIPASFDMTTPTASQVPDLPFWKSSPPLATPGPITHPLPSTSPYSLTTASAIRT